MKLFLCMGIEKNQSCMVLQLPNNPRRDGLSMVDVDERLVGDLIVSIDRSLCVGFGDCVDEFEPAFALADDGVAVFSHPERVAPGTLMRACEACPVDALSYRCKAPETD